MTLKELVEKWLRENGYDGLFNPDDCACDLNDLFPCDCPQADCEPGYLCDCDCRDHDWHICREKP